MTKSSRMTSAGRAKPPSLDLTSVGRLTLDVSTLYAATGTTKLADLPAYVEASAGAVPRGYDL